MNTFDLLHPTIQKSIYKMGWERFRAIQDEAIQYLVKTPGDLIISAPTASGKTEACFLPIISNIVEDKRHGVKILYISPLKALINDQFTRVEKLCEELKFPIVKWHGDANLQDKKELVKNPDGILLITPESIESLFLNKRNILRDMFKNLQYIVIDEIHSLLETPRGNHLFSLLNRLEDVVGKKIPKIALSATINDFIPVQKWLNFDNPESVKIIRSDERVSDGLVGIIKGYDMKKYNKKLLTDLYETTKCNKNLIFENCKNQIEQYCVNIKGIAKNDGLSNRFHIHHGFLSKEIRETVELKLKKEKDITVFNTSTLELGIDIGDIDKVVFLEAPKSISSTIQRMGRSGRKTGKSRNFQILVEELPIDTRSAYADKFRIQTIQSIAVVELLAREKWCEPLKLRFDYSTIVHQILSLLGGSGGMNANALFTQISIAFKNTIKKERFTEILKALRDNDIIYQTSSGLISLAEKGENLVHSYKFYPAFVSTENFEINFNGMVIGFIDATKHDIAPGDNIVIAGKQWIILSINENAKKIMVKRSNGGEPKFITSELFPIHRKIQQKMKEIYDEKITNFPYLDDTAKLFLKQAINEYNTAKSKVLMICGGTKVQNTLNFLFKYNLEKADLDLLEDFFIGFYHFKGKKFLLDIVKKMDINHGAIFNVLMQKDIKNIRKSNKFDNLLPKELLIEEYINENFDIEGTKEVVTSL